MEKSVRSRFRRVKIRHEFTLSGSHRRSRSTIDFPGLSLLHRIVASALLHSPTAMYLFLKRDKLSIANEEGKSQSISTNGENARCECPCRELSYSRSPCSPSRRLRCLSA